MQDKLTVCFYFYYICKQHLHMRALLHNVQEVVTEKPNGLGGQHQNAVTNIYVNHIDLMSHK